MFSNILLLSATVLTVINAQGFTFKETYPEPGVIPIAKPEWLDLLKNANISDAPVLKVTPGVGPGPQPQGDPHCDWTFTGCLGKDDLYQCPKGQWAPTYDDGPSEFSAKLYDELDKTNTKATFFMVGGQVVQFPELTQRAFKSGHELAMHTWSHQYMTSLTNEQIVAELKWNELAIKEVTGMSPRFFRPPFGDIDNRVRDVAKALGFTPVIWTHDTHDWRLTEDKSFDTKWIDGNVTKWAFDAKTMQNGGVSLEHDLYNTTVDAAVRVLPILLHGFKVTTVGDCNKQPSYKEVDSLNATSSSASVSSPGASVNPRGTAGDSIELVNKRGVDPGTSGEILADKTIALWNRICLNEGGNYGSCTEDSGMNADWKGGCHKGYCWAGCFGGCPCQRNQVKEWCWTGSRGFGYRSCKQDSDCDINWPCAGTCTV